MQVVTDCRIAVSVPVTNCGTQSREVSTQGKRLDACLAHFSLAELQGLAGAGRGSRRGGGGFPQQDMNTLLFAL